MAKYQKILCMLGIVAVFSTSLAFADANSKYTLLEPLPCIKGASDSSLSCQEGTLVEEVKINEYVQFAFNLMVGLAALLAVVMIVYGGFLTMTSDSISRKSEGKKKLKDAIYGLVMILGTILILRTINPALVNIPPTLVPPLEMTDRTNAYSNILTRLEQQGAYYLNKENENRAQQDEAKRKIEELTLKLESLNNDLREAYGDPAKQASIQFQITQVKNELNTELATRDVSAALKYFYSTTALQINSTDNGERSTLNETQFRTLVHWESLISNKYIEMLPTISSYNIPQKTAEFKNGYYENLTNVILLQTEKDNLIQDITPKDARAKLTKLKQDISENVTDPLKSKLLLDVQVDLDYINKTWYK